MRVLAIDLGSPGGLCILVSGGEWGSVLSWRRLPKGMDLGTFQSTIGNVLDAFGVGLVAMEKPGTWGNPWIGMSQRGRYDIVKALCQQRGIRVASFAPSEVKRAIAGSGKASKAQVARAVQRMIGFAPGDEHCSDAGALAIIAMSRELCQAR